MPPISPKQIIDSPKVVSALNDINEALKVILDNLSAVVGEGKKVSETLANSKGIKDFNKQVDALNKNREEAAKLTQEQINILKKEEELKAKVAQTTAAQERAAQAKNRTTIQERKELERLAKEEAKQLKASTQLTGAYAKKSKALNEARKEAKDLAAEYGVLDKRFIKAQKEVNKLDEELKGIDSSLGQNQRSVGDYEKATSKLIVALNKARKKSAELNKQEGVSLKVRKDARLEVARLEKEFKKTTSSSNSIKDSFVSNNDALRNLGGGFTDLIDKGKAFIATPIGLVVTAITGAIALMTKAVGRSEKATESFNKVGAFFSGILAGITEALVPLAEFLGDTLVGLLENPMETIEELGQLLLDNLINRGKAVVIIWEAVQAAFGGDFNKAAKLATDGMVQLHTGITNATDKASDFIDVVKEVQEATINAANAEREYAKAQIEFEKTQLRLQNEAEKLRQIRDDESLQIEERIKANDELGKTLDRQLAMELKLANEGLERARNLQVANGETIESIEAIGEAEIKLLEIEERITGQRSEQLTNTNALLKEQRDLEIEMFNEKNKAIADGLKGLNKEIEASEKELNDEIEALEEEYLSSYFDSEDERLKKAQETEEAILELKQNFAKQAEDLATEFLNDQISKGSEGVQAELDQEQELLDEKLELAGDDQEQKDALQAEFDLKEKELKNKKAKAEKDEALYKIGIDTAIGIAKAVAESPLTFGLPFSAFVAGQGAASAALVAGKSTPQFDKGTKSAPKGGFIAGEKRTEIGEHKGKSFLIDTPTYFGDDYAGMKITGGAETADILEQATRSQVVNIKQDNKGSEAAFAALFNKHFEKHSNKMISAIKANKPTDNTNVIKEAKRLNKYKGW